MGVGVVLIPPRRHAILIGGRRMTCAVVEFRTAGILRPPKDGGLRMKSQWAFSENYWVLIEEGDERAN
jgi:hypothetical protein